MGVEGEMGIPPTMHTSGVVLEWLHHMPKTPPRNGTPNRMVVSEMVCFGLHSLMQ